MVSDLRIAELLCARLCHDLTGPIGAVNNGAEFLSEEGFNMQGQAVELITSSAFSAVTRLQFYRMAYGLIKDQGEANLSDRRQLAADFLSSSKITLLWPDEYVEGAGIAISIRMARLLFNLLLVASGALLRGGSLSVQIVQDEQGGKVITLVAEGQTVKWDESNALMFKSGIAPEQISPKTVQHYLTQRLADELGAQLSFTLEGEKLLVKAVQPPRPGGEAEGE